MLDKGIAFMELLYSIQKCHSYKTHEDARTAHRNEPAALRSPYMPQAQIAPCYAGALDEILTELPGCCHRAGVSAEPCIAAIERLQSRAQTTGLAAAYRQCVQLEDARASNAALDARAVKGACLRAAAAVVDTVWHVLRGARGLYLGHLRDPRDITPSAFALMHMCDEIHPVRGLYGGKHPLARNAALAERSWHARARSEGSSAEVQCYVTSQVNKR